jgi:hypothetical protein
MPLTQRGTKCRDRAFPALRAPGLPLLGCLEASRGHSLQQSLPGGFAVPEEAGGDPTPYCRPDFWGHLLCALIRWESLIISHPGGIPP